MFDVTALFYAIGKFSVPSYRAPSLRGAYKLIWKMHYVSNMARKIEQVHIMSEELGELMWTCSIFIGIYTLFL